jgi:hypothetical protein
MIAKKEHVKNLTFVFTIFATLLQLAFADSIGGAIEISQSITRDTTWTDTDTINVTGTVTVYDAARLSIEPGTIIRFSPGTGFVIRGQLTAGGQPDRHILFVAAADSSNAEIQAGQWNGLHFHPNSKGTLRFCDMRYARNGVRIDQTSVVLYGCTIENFSARGIYVDGSTTDPPDTTIVEHCLIRQSDTAVIGSGVGILANRSVYLTVSGCKISHCKYGVQFGATQVKATQFDITGCTIRDHAIYGIYIVPTGCCEQLTPTGRIRQCNILNNGEYALYVSSTNYPITILDATDNWWGTTDSTAIEDMVYHQIDLSFHPLVDYTPFADSAFEYGNPLAADTITSREVKE